MVPCYTDKSVYGCPLDPRAAAGHDVVIGTRDPQATLARTEPDLMGAAPFAQWHQSHGQIDVARFAEMLLTIWLRLWGALGTADFNFKIAR
ncbi:hypothetical protein [Arthrobacter sp. TB 26]|uniref:hypothetical protein n=1 Tax=Arthrobacter sp. TB 26 TaxID=494420 RepID=UPI0004147FFF|nr:hypothetical protein [Arthrobacter sp. TB 26]